MSGSVRLNDEVFFCITEGVGIFLDLKRDEYSAITLPPEMGVSEAEISEAAILNAFEIHRLDLVRENLLVEGSDKRVDPAAYQFLVRPVSHIFDPDDQRAFGLTGEEGRAVHVRPRDLFDFFLASRKASSLLKKQHFYDVVAKVRERKTTTRHNRDDVIALRRETAIYRKLRPWYPRPYLCLYDGLALIEFLSRRGLFPDWVFAVQAQPFGAHCWVQTGEFILNETMEYAGQFTPIMAI